MRWLQVWADPIPLGAVGCQAEDEGWSWQCHCCRCAWFSAWTVCIEWISSASLFAVKCCPRCTCDSQCKEIKEISTGNSWSTANPAWNDGGERVSALQALHADVPRRAVLMAVYDYWRGKRDLWGKPILRRLQPPPSVTDTNPYHVFRPREKAHRPHTRRVTICSRWLCKIPLQHVHVNCCVISDAAKGKWHGFIWEAATGMACFCLPLNWINSLQLDWRVSWAAASWTDSTKPGGCTSFGRNSGKGTCSSSLGNCCVRLPWHWCRLCGRRGRRKNWRLLNVRLLFSERHSLRRWGTTNFSSFVNVL